MKTDVLIIGGGPVGLFLAIALKKKGMDCSVIEKQSTPVLHSRSLGIHPVSLELFDKYDIIDPFHEAGLKINKGIAFQGKKKIGEISFEKTPKPFNYIMTCPQYKTEEILQDQLNAIDAEVLRRKTEFMFFEITDDGVRAKVKSEKKEWFIDADYIVGCDGKNSKVREQAGIKFKGEAYPDTYIMGDFSDNTDFGSDAAVYIPKQGLVECFPLPNGMRRWVVRMNGRIENPNRALLEKEIHERLDHDLSNAENVMASSFGVQHYLAETMAKGRVLLAGDAAHVISPIGGQGMNLGWLDGDRLVEVLESKGDLNKDYSDHQRKVVKRATKRAEINMSLGRSYSSGFFKSIILNLMLHTPLKHVMTRLFTMRHLHDWWI